MRPRYAIDQSPLYKLQTKKNLADILKIPWDEFKEIKKAGSDNYKFFDKTIEKNGKTKIRHIEHPKKRLRDIQKRISFFLSCIEKPVYMHSGFKKVSFLTNALSHECNVRVAKIDIKSFFPSSRATAVYRCFNEDFKCSPDVSEILTNLTTVKEHLPTGGNSSSILSFYAYRPMFDEICALALANELQMTCCVDDMTFSGEKATKGFLFEVSKIVHSYGLKTHKCHCFTPKQPKIVTGVVITPNGYRLPNSSRSLLHQAMNNFQNETDAMKRIKLGQELLGRVANAAEVEDRFKPLLPHVKKLLGLKSK